MKRKLLLFLLGVVVISTTKAQIVYQMTTINASSGVPTNWSASALTIQNPRPVGGTVTSNGSFSSTFPSDTYTDASGGNNVSINPLVVDVAGNGDVSGLSYFEVTITPETGVQVQITNISFGSRSTTVGPQSFKIRSSVDAFAADIASGSLTRSGAWEYKNNTLATRLDGSSGSPVTLRFYANNPSSSNTPSWRFDDLKITGLGVLPVNLTFFNGKKQDESIQLNWTTASEKNNSHFNILRSIDGKKFQNIGKVAGKGNSDELVNYTFTDVNPLGGTNYYQLHQFDFDGKSSKSDVVAVESGLKTTEMMVYADQSSNQLKLSVFSANATSGTIRVYDLGGKQILNQEIELTKGYNNLSFSVQLNSGVFVSTLQTPTETISKKFTNR